MDVLKGRKEHFLTFRPLLAFYALYYIVSIGDYIDKIHERWFGNFSHLEIHHGYIQWIFPIREEGVNFSAARLQKHELKAIRQDLTIRARVIRSYEMMLDFYGMVLKDRDTGTCL
jgi:hypothetical protein